MAFLLLGLATVAVYQLTDAAAVEAGIAVGTTAAAAVALLAGIKLHRPAAPIAWYLLALGQLTWLGGWVFWQRGILATGAPPASFSLADLLFLGSFPLVIGGLIALLRAREPGGGGLIEVAILAVGGALLSSLLVAPYLTDGAIPAELRATQGVYALFDLIVLAVLARALLGAPRGRAWLLLLASTASLLAADTAWNWLSFTGNYTAGGYSDVGWLGFSVLLGAAALDPTMADAGRPTGPRRAGLDARRVAVVSLAVICIPCFSVLELVLDRELDGPAVVAATVLLALLVAARVVALLFESERLRRAYAEQNAELKQLDRLKDDFVASVSHELRTPLTSIRGYLELVRDGEAGDLTTEQDSFLGVVDRNAERLLRVVGDLLFVAQLDAGSVPLERGTVDLRQLAHDAADSARPVAAERGIALSLELGELPAGVPGDASRLAQALDNLVSNALKFTPSGGTVALRAAASNGHVELAVADTGHGIDEADQRRLFQRFFRTASASEQAVPGTGLGLAITKAIVEAHGGTIGVSSEVGAGSEFRIVLPAAA